MKHYKVYPELDSEDNLLWYVYELSTDQIVAEFFFEEDAIELCKFLESGHGFAGHTPTFMIRKVSLGKDINEAFSAEFA